MPTRPSQSAADIVADGHSVLAAAKANSKAFRAYDVNRKKKILEPALLARLAANLDAAKKASGGVVAGKAGVGDATAREVKARKDLFVALTQIRDEVRLAYPGDKDIARAFGVGKKLADKVTNPLLTAADGVIETYRNKDLGFGARAKEAGVTAARVNALGRLRDALAGADQTQGAQIGGRKSASTLKAGLLVAIKKDTAHIRAAAKLVLKGNAKALPAFESRVARRAVTKRPAKPAPPAPPDV